MEAPLRAASGVTLGKAIESLLFAKKSANYRPKYVKSLRHYLSLFARGREDMDLSAITVDVIEQWFMERDEALSSMASNVGRLSALFSFSERRQWIERNPCDFLERVRLDEKPAQILTLEQCRSLMEWAMYKRPIALAYFTLALFPGVRPEETESLTKEDCNLETGVIRISAEVAKVRTQRWVHLEPNALEWLRFAFEIGGKLPLSRSTRCRVLSQAAQHLGFADGWPQDILRHTAASYLMALKRDAGLVADEMGNSPSVLLRRYRNLVTQEDRIAFWNLTP